MDAIDFFSKYFIMPAKAKKTAQKQKWFHEQKCSYPDDIFMTSENRKKWHTNNNNAKLKGHEAVFSADAEKNKRALNLLSYTLVGQSRVTNDKNFHDMSVDDWSRAAEGLHYFQSINIHQRIKPISCGKENQVHMSWSMYGVHAHFYIKNRNLYWHIKKDSQLYYSDDRKAWTINNFDKWYGVMADETKLYNEFIQPTNNATLMQLMYLYKVIKWVEGKN